MFKIKDFFMIKKSLKIPKLFVRLYVKFDILLTCGNHLHDRIASHRVEIGAHRPNLIIPPLFIEVPVPS